MRALVTGAGGMLGQAVVSQLLKQGVAVRALVRPAASIERLGWSEEGVDVFRADLRVSGDLVDAFEDVDVLVHLAAAVTGSEDLQFASAVVGTERLLEAMARSRTTDLVLASSYSVYDWRAFRRRLTERTPLDIDLYDRDGYAIAKIWQERVTRRLSQRHGWRLAVLRPGFIWGRENALFAGAGQSLGSAFAVVAPLAKPPLTHVENCASAFVAVATHMDRAADRTFNVVDDHDITTWRYVGRYAAAARKRLLRIPVPYRLGLGLVHLANGASRLAFGPKGKLPSLLVPRRFEARFKPVRSDFGALRESIGWTPPHSLAECMDMTYGSSGLPATRTAHAEPAPELARD